MEGGDGVAIRFIFEILDRDYIEKVRQERGYGINPWDDLSKVSYCCSSVRPTLVRFAPGSTISDLPACSFLTKLTMRLRLAADRCRKPNVQGTRVTCPWHGADFDLKTGAVLGICYKQVQAPATHYITLNGHSVERTSRRAHGSVLSALPTLGEPGMGPNVVQEPFLRCASQSFKRRRKRLVAWILHLSATDPLLATYSPKRSRPRCRRLALETDHIPAKFFDPIRYRRRHKNACTYSGTF
jgi:hypothetical protein